jgi:hypothetical protein
VSSLAPRGPPLASASHSSPSARSGTNQYLTRNQSTVERRKPMEPST